MKLNCIGYRPIGMFKSVDSMRDMAILENFSRGTLRETEEIENNPQRDTNIVVGMYDMIGDVAGVYEPDVMDKYDKFLPEIVGMLEDFYGYKFVQLKSFSFIILRAGDEIYPHKDDDAVGYSSDYDYCHRIHLPLQTNDDVIFTIEGEDRHLKYGELIEIDNLKEHSVVNNGNTDRIHLLIDFYGLKDYYDKELGRVPKEFYKEK